MSTQSDEYMAISRRFAELTAVRHPESGRCCAKVDLGAPECCFTVVDNTSCLVATDLELSIVHDVGIETFEPDEFHGVSFTHYSQGVTWTKHGRFWFSGPEASTQGKRMMASSLWRHRLAMLVECTAHPTRPIVAGDLVVGVAAIHGCIAEWNLEHLQANRDEFAELWQRYIDLIGVKPYFWQVEPSIVLL